MTSVFPFGRGSGNRSGAAAAAPLAAGAGAPGQALTDLLNALRPHVQDLPGGSVAVASVNEKALGLGNWRGTQNLGPFAVLGLRGGHLQVTVRFQFQGSQPGPLDDAARTLQGRLLTNRDALWAAGLLRVTGTDTTPAEFLTGANMWRKAAEYAILYEFRYLDSEGAESLIARIPIESDPETQDSPARETFTVTDEMVRWDNEGASSLRLRGPLAVRGLSTLSFVPPTAPAGAITLTRTFDTASGSPASFPTLADFLAAITGPSPQQRHARVTFASLTDFLNALGPVGGTLTLGDWNGDGVADVYQSRTMPFPAPVQLAGFADRFEASCDGSKFDQVAVVYLRASR